MTDPVWGDMLIALRREHLQQLQAFRNQATERRLDLNWQHRQERVGCEITSELARLIYQQTEQLIDLQQQRELDYQALRRRHAEEIYGLLQFKFNNF